MRLLPLLDSFHDELEKIAKSKKASASSGALIGGMIGAGLMPKKWMMRGGLVGAGIGGLMGGAASLGQKLLEPTQGQLMAAQQRGWEPAGYVPSYQRAGF